MNNTFYWLAYCPSPARPGRWRLRIMVSAGFAKQNPRQRNWAGFINKPSVYSKFYGHFADPMGRPVNMQLHETGARQFRAAYRWQ